MLDILYHRRSTRKFTDQKIAPELIDQIIAAGLLSPSSKGGRPWEFIVVDDPQLLERLSEAKPHSAMLLKHAPLAIIIAGNPSQSDVWIEDCSIATILIQLEVEALGLGSCWVQIHRRFYDDEVSSNEYIRHHFQLPNHLEVLSVVGIGYKASERPRLTESDLEWSKVKLNQYKKPFK